MTLSPSEHPEASGAVPALGAVPPPGCPAHAMGTGQPGTGTGTVRRLYGPEAEADPRGLYEKLRAEHGAVAPVLVEGDLPAWLVLGYQENLDVARTPSRFSRDSRQWRDLLEGRVAPTNPLAPIATWQPMCTFMDGEEHQRLRQAVTDGLARFDRRGVRRHVTRYANQLIDAFVGLRPGRAGEPVRRAPADAGAHPAARHARGVRPAPGRGRPGPGQGHRAPPWPATTTSS